MKNNYLFPGWALLRDILNKHSLLIVACLFFQHLTAQPIVNSFTPASGPIGTSVTITGANFSSIVNDNTVYFGAVKATVTAANATSLTVTVPAGASHQPVTVSTNGLTAYSAKPFIVTFTGGDVGFLPNSFDEKFEFVSGVQPYSIVIGDLDGDGKPDLVTSNISTDNVTVFKNTTTNGIISFADGINYRTAWSPYKAILHDLNGDGKLDLVVITRASNLVSVFINTSNPGTISFARNQDFATGNNPISISANDLDGDGKPDLVIANQSSNTISILRNTGTGGAITFSANADYPTGTTPYSVFTSDLTADGKPEIAVTNAGSNTVSVFKNTSTAGTISFDAKVDYATGANPRSLVADDLDEDGKPDLIVANQSASSISIFKNEVNSGTISFAAKVDYPTINGPTYLTMGDMDGDGKADVVHSAASGAGLAGIFKNNSTTGAISLGNAVFYQTNISFGIAANDLNGDGKPDLATIGSNVDKVIIRRNKVNEPIITSFTPNKGGAGTVVSISGHNFTDATAVSFGGVPAASFTVNSSTSITAVTGTGATGSIAVTTSYGTGTLAGFTAAPAITSFSPTSGMTGTSVTITGNNFTGATAVSFGGVPAASFTVNSSTSITAVVGTGASGNVSVVSAGGSGAIGDFIFNPPPVITSFTPTSGISGATITITGENFIGTSAVSFGGSPAASFTVESATLIKAVVGTGSSGPVSVTTPYGNTSLAGFIGMPTITSFAPTSGMVGTTVTITGFNFNSNITDNIVYFGSVRATVSAATTTSIVVTVPPGTSFQPLTVTTYGVTAYASQPFIVTFPGSNEAFNTVPFAPGIEIPADVNPYGISVSDLDLDGKPDLVVTNQGSGTVSIYKNTSTSGNISFAPKIDYATGNGPQSVAIGDLNGDGKPDLVIGNYYSDAVSVFRNTGSSGTISFDPKIDYTTGPRPQSVTLGDLDGDGRPEIAVANSHFGYSVSVFKNLSTSGTVAFANKTDISVDDPYSIAIGDLNGDGKGELITTSFYSYPVGVYRNTSSNGVISFGTKQELWTGDSPVSACTTDLDGDGKPDLAIATYNSHKIYVFKNTSNVGGIISFHPYIESFTCGNFPLHLSSNDMDGDGKPDLIVANSGSNTVAVLKNKILPGHLFDFKGTDYTVGGNPVCSFSSDLDGDGKPDLIVANRTSNTISLLRNVVGDAKTVPSGTNPISGDIIKKLTIDPVVQTQNGVPYVQRHYDIEPVNNPSTGTATVTLYFAQQDFDNFNAHPSHGFNLPTGPTDMAGKGNLRVYQYHGFSTTSLPGSYSGSALEIDPDDDKIVWNAEAQWWEVTFNVTGFSGFFVSSAGSAILPLRLLSFTGNQQGANAELRWTSADEINVDRFELQRSTTGSDFNTVATIRAAGNSITSRYYQYIDPLGDAPVYYYRLRMVDNDGSVDYSYIIRIKPATTEKSFTIYPNPASNYVIAEHPSDNHNSYLSIMDVTGRVIKTINVRQNTWQTKVDINGLPQGTYKIIWSDGVQMITKSLMVK